MCFSVSIFREHFGHFQSFQQRYPKLIIMYKVPNALWPDDDYRFPYAYIL